MGAIRFAWLLGSVTLAGVLAAPAREGALPGPIQAEVVRVIDGDTLAVRARIWLDQDVATVVRIDGIDAPELKGACAAERERAIAAQAALVRLIGDGQVALIDVRHDKYGGRVRATVATAAGVVLADALIAA